MPNRRNRRRHSGGGDALMQGLDFLKNAPGKQMGGGSNALQGAPVVGGDSMLLEGGLRETAGVARLDASVGEIRGMSDQAGGRRRKSRKAGRKAGRKSRKTRKSRKAGRKSRKSERKSRKSERKSRKAGRKSRKAGRKSRKSERKSRKAGRKSRSNRKSRMNGGGHQGSPVHASPMLLTDYSKTGSGFTGNAFRDGAGSV